MNKINMANKEIININGLNGNDKKNKFYNDLVYLIYGVKKEHIFFKDNDNTNLSRDNCIIITIEN
jgi:hypothetical protein